MNILWRYALYECKIVRIIDFLASWSFVRLLGRVSHLENYLNHIFEKCFRIWLCKCIILFTVPLFVWTRVHMALKRHSRRHSVSKGAPSIFALIAFFCYFCSVRGGRCIVFWFSNLFLLYLDLEKTGHSNIEEDFRFILYKNAFNKYKNII